MPGGATEVAHVCGLPTGSSHAPHRQLCHAPSEGRRRGELEARRVREATPPADGRLNIRRLSAWIRGATLRGALHVERQRELAIHALLSRGALRRPLIASVMQTPPCAEDVAGSVDVAMNNRPLGVRADLIRAHPNTVQLRGRAGQTPRWWSTASLMRLQLHRIARERAPTQLCSADAA